MTPTDRAERIGREWAEQLAELLPAASRKGFAMHLAIELGDVAEDDDLIASEVVATVITTMQTYAADVAEQWLKSNPATEGTGIHRAALAAACDKAWQGDLAAVPLPPNPFLVTRHNDAVMFQAGGMRTLTPDAATLLGVWLLAVADPTLSTAALMLAKVATR